MHEFVPNPCDVAAEPRRYLAPQWCRTRALDASEPVDLLASVTVVIVRVVVADDEPLVRSGIAMLLSADPDIEVVAEAGDGVAAVEAVEHARPDVAVVDVRMPRMDGVEATRRIVERFPLADGSEQPPVSVLVLTTYNLDEAVYAALRAGASGFLLKDAAPNELLDAVKALARGEGWLDPSVTKSLLKEFATLPEAGLPGAEAFGLLTPRELEVLVLMAHAMSNAQIAAHLVIGEGTVKTHVSRILMKLGLHDRVQPWSSPSVPDSCSQTTRVSAADEPLVRLTRHPNTACPPGIRSDCAIWKRDEGQEWRASQGAPRRKYRAEGDLPEEAWTCLRRSIDAI